MVENNVLYNVTIKIAKEVEDEWVSWMTNTHIPEVLATKCFLSSRMNKLLYLEDEDGATYSIQYLSNNMKDLQIYLGSHAPKLQDDVKIRYENKFVAFRTIMEVLQDF